MPASQSNRLAAPQTAETAFALYIHWPYCRHKCPYCDFNSHVRPAIDHAGYRRALLAELAHWADRLGPRRVASVFFGGGTPSLMRPDTVAAILDAAAGHWQLAPDAEITLEANPTSAEAEAFRGFAAAGVNRLSLGLQALDDRALSFLGRQHSAAEGLAALEQAKRHFDRVSFDLIYARPGQSLADWRRELSAALARASGHISLYQLTVEVGTNFFQAVRRGDWCEMDDDEAAAFYEETQAATQAAGLPAYEISNHAAPGQQSRHNLAYWRYGEYLGLGPGAHGRPLIAGMRHASRQRRSPEAWLARVESQGHGGDACVPLEAAERAREMLMMALRLNEGLALERFEAECGMTLADAVDGEALAQLTESGFLELDESRLRASRRGLPLLNTLLAHLLS